MPFGLLKQIPHPGSANAYKHFYKVRTAYAEEGNPGLAGNGPGQQCLACPRRAIEQHPFRYTRPQLRKLAGGTEEFHNFFKLFLSFVDAGNIIKRNLLPGLLMQLGPAFAEIHHPAAAALSLLHKEKENQN